MTVISKHKISLYSSLSQKKMRKRHSLFIVEGEKCVEDTIGSFHLDALVATERWFETHGSLIKDIETEKLYTATENEIKKISSLSSLPDVLAVYELPVKNDAPYERVDVGNLNLVLDGIQDPGNLGTIIRTAHWFGVKRIFASEDTADIYNPKTLQSTMGSVAKVEVNYCDIEKLLEKYKEMPVYGTLLDGKNIYCEPLGDRGFIVMGNEGKGITEKIRKFISRPLLIPPFNTGDHSESLNVAIATGITLSEFRSRQALKT